MSGPAERFVAVRGARCRVWEKGEGEPLGFLAGPYGLPRWPPFLDRLARRRRVVAPSLPGFPGGGEHAALDERADWIVTCLDRLEQSGLDGADLVGASVGAALAAEVAAFSRASVRRLVLIAPFGLFDAGEPVTDLGAASGPRGSALLAADRERLAAFLRRPDGVERDAWEDTLTRARDAALRSIGPLDRPGLARRLHRITAPTLLLWGSEDRVVPGSYAKRFAAGISGWVESRAVEGAGHMAEIDRPDVVADAVLAFLA